MQIDCTRWCLLCSVNKKQKVMGQEKINDNTYGWLIRWIVRTSLYVIWVFDFLYILAKCAPDDRSPRPQEYKPIRDERLYTPRPTKSYGGARYYASPDDPWYQDCNETTIEWQDFLEDIEMRGIGINDPEAEEIWETYN